MLSACEDEGSALLLFRAPILQAVLDNPMVQWSRSFGFAEIVSKHLALCMAGFRMAYPGGEMGV